jgi:hypothetical protein
MRRVGLLFGLVTLAIASFGSLVVAETNQDSMIRLRFTSNVTAVFGSHPNLQVGDVLVFEISTSGDTNASVATDDFQFCTGMEDAGSCTVFKYVTPGTWHLEYRRSGDVVHSEDGTFTMVGAVEGGSETDCFDVQEGESCYQNDNHDYLGVSEDSVGLDPIIRFEAPSDWNPLDQPFSQMLAQANGDDIWSVNFFTKHWGNWGTYQYDYMTSDKDARVSIPAGLTFDENGGRFDSDRIGGDPSEVVVVPDREPTRDGYKFVSWNTSTDGSGTSYAPGASFTLGAEGEVETLFAQWAVLPDEPTGLSVEVGSGEALLTWTAPVSSGDSPVTGYQVQSSTNGTDWTTEIADTSAQGVMVRSIGGVATAATVTGLTNGTAYQFRVAAINSYGVGAYSTASSPATPNTTTTTTVADSTTTTVADTTTTVATLPVTGSSNGSINPVLLALGFGGLLALLARRRVTER